VLFQKSSFFLRSFLAWVSLYVPSFVSENLLDLICFLDCTSL
jgi:hypothetical protein